MARTDGDSWDLASSVGVTATMVAAARAVATKADEPLIDDPFAEPLVRAVGVDFLTRWVSGELDLEAVEDQEQGWGLQQMPYAMAARTRFFDAFLADATAAGIRQAVILASGLDSRAYRLEWPAGACVFEIDQPQVIAFKRAALSELNAAPTAALRSLAVDLRDDWASALTDAGFDAGAPSAWIAEGLLGYLPPQAQDRLLDTLTALSAPGTRLATESIRQDADGDAEEAREKMRELAAKYRKHGFDMDLSELGYEGDRHEVGEYLAARGWTSHDVTMSKLLSENGFPPIAQPDGARTLGDVVYCTSTKS